MIPQTAGDVPERFAAWYRLLYPDTDDAALARAWAYRSTAEQEFWKGLAVVHEEPASYLIDGNLDGKGWVPYATLGHVSEDDALAVYRSWQDSRDKSSFSTKYRLLRRHAYIVTVASEVPKERK